MPMADYRTIPRLNISRLKELQRSAQHYLHALEHPKETAPLRLGQASHCAVLEPERFERQFATWERRTEGGAMAPRRGQYWEEFERANKGKEIITADEDALARAIAKAVRTDACAMKYLETGEPEVVLEWDMHGRQCKGRVDWITHLEGVPYLVGLKSARDCRPFLFGSQAAKLGYHLQWAWYLNGYAAIKGGEKPRMVEIVVENTAPHAVVVYSIPDDVLLQGEEDFLSLLRVLERCESEGVWPGPGDGHEQTLTLPSWVYQADDDIADLGLEA